MKTALKILTLSILIGFFAFNAFSQECKESIVSQTELEKPDTRTAEEKLEESEVKKFVDSFLQEMDEKKDIKKVSEKLFVAKFKEIFAKNSHWDNHISKHFRKDLVEESRFEELYRGNAEMLNFVFLQMMSISGNDLGFDSDSIDETGDDSERAFYTRIFSNSVVDLMLSNNRIAEMFELNGINDERSKEFETLNEINNFNLDLNRVNAAIIKHIESQPDSWHKTYQKRAADYRTNRIYYHYRKENCKAEDCKGLPENTAIYEFTSFPLVFQVINDLGNYKVLDVYILSN
jgi:hypothetical protein